MHLEFETNLAIRYKSLPQKIRVVSENWVNKEVYCPNCGNTHLDKYSNNKPAADFFCDNCNEDYELKSKGNGLGLKIVDGAYQGMLNRLQDVNSPNLFMLNYDSNSYLVSNFFVIPKHFFVPEIIEKRKPLSVNARRAGWIGCNILLSKIPEVGRIFLVRDQQIVSKQKVCEIWQKTLFLREEKKIDSRGWLLDIMRCIELIRKEEFTLADIYKFESILSKQHPDNRHIKDKIRQQLQILRDRNYIQFSGRGEYRIL